RKSKTRRQFLSRIISDRRSSSRRAWKAGSHLSASLAELGVCDRRRMRSCNIGGVQKRSGRCLNSHAPNDARKPAGPFAFELDVTGCPLLGDWSSLFFNGRRWDLCTWWKLQAE